MTSSLEELALPRRHGELKALSGNVNPGRELLAASLAHLKLMEDRLYGLFVVATETAGLN
jgi:hypothetical protein